MRTYFHHHYLAFIQALTQFVKTPVATMLTIAVVGIALALPSSLLVLLNNVKVVSRGWEGGNQITLYFKRDVAATEIEKAIAAIKLRQDISHTRYISPDEGLRELEAHAGFRNILRQLPENPLPAVLEVYPSMDIQDPEVMQRLLSSLQQLPEVQSAKLDMQWLQRLSQIIALVQRGVTVMLVLLALAVLLVVGNTIRLATQNHQEEISILKLIGATDAFVRRPFLYVGILYGLLGGLVAWSLNNIMILILDNPVQELARLYNSIYSLLGLSTLAGLGLMLFGGSLGYLGSWLAVRRHLAAIAPR